MHSSAQVYYYFYTEELVSAWHVLVVLPSPTCILCTSPYKASYMHAFGVPLLCVLCSTQVCFSELVDETLATHCQVAFLRLFSHGVGPWAVLCYLIHD